MASVRKLSQPTTIASDIDCRQEIGAIAKHGFAVLSARIRDPDHGSARATTIEFFEG
jgi:hypothetical protein